MQRVLILTLFLVFGAAGVFAQAVEDFRFEAGDQMSVSVLEDPALNTTVLVRPDGRVSLPLVGTITVAGRTPEAVQDIIRRALGQNFLSPPTVTVSLVALSGEATTDRFYVLGEIGRPGPYEFDRPITILQALALAGGPSRFAAADRIQLRRMGPQGEQMFLFDYEVATDGLVPTTPMLLQDGDVLIVPTRGLFE